MLLKANFPIEQKSKTDNLYSTSRIGDLIIELLDTGSFEVDDREFIEVQRDALYDRRFVADDFRGSLGEKFIRPFRAIVGKDEKLVIYKDEIDNHGEYYINDELQDMEFYSDRVAEILEVIK